jgi:plasmid stabilization system protein ParE
MAKVIWTDQAIEDINNIAEFIAKDSFKYAQIQVNKFFDLALLLENNSKIGRRVPEINDNSIREIISGSYRIIYKIRSGQEILIITVHHSSRSMKSNPNI